MSRSEANQSKKQGESKKGSHKKIVIAAISGAVTVIVAIIGCVSTNVGPIGLWLLNRTPVPTRSVTTPSPFSITPTVTNVSGVTAADLPCTLNHDCSAGMDWTNNCIAGYVWTVYSSSDLPVLSKDGLECYSQPILDVFYTKDGGLDIFAQPVYLISSKDYGLFAMLPQNGKVTVSLDLDKIDNGQVWFGIFESPDVKSEGVLLVAPPGDVRQQAFALKTMPTDNRIEVSRVYQNPAGKYTLGFDLEYGSVTANVEGDLMTPIPFTSPSRWLFIGYRAKLDDPKNGNAFIQALFTDLKIIPNEQ